jgi:hypothetical protein
MQEHTNSSLVDKNPPTPVPVFSLSPPRTFEAIEECGAGSVPTGQRSYSASSPSALNSVDLDSVIDLSQNLQLTDSYDVADGGHITHSLGHPDTPSTGILHTRNKQSEVGINSVASLKS